ncbi:chromate transporter [Comamonas sp. AG1104]|uniref:chromate transporter n=1 Tax=Comamonas sp. AG1104 TaxID=2183900 RepID=UPI0013146232|nr:chromate transporter [Comamonas sp. AG1104]
MTNPGPIVSTPVFNGFLVHGFRGVVEAAAATFCIASCSRWFYLRISRNMEKKPGFIAIVRGITAAAIGKIIGAVAVIAQRSITDGIAAAISIISTVTQWKLQTKLPGPVIVAAASDVGLVIYQLDH